MSLPERRLPVAMVGGLHADARRAAIGDILHAVPGTVVLHHGLSAAPDGTVYRTVRDLSGPVSSGHTLLVND